MLLRMLVVFSSEKAAPIESAFRLLSTASFASFRANLYASPSSKRLPLHSVFSEASHVANSSSVLVSVAIFCVSEEVEGGGGCLQVV